MKIMMDDMGTITDIHFCCMRLSRKMLPIFHDREVPIVINRGSVRARGFSLHYCPYCGERIEKEQIARELSDPLNSNDVDLEELSM